MAVTEALANPPYCPNHGNGAPTGRLSGMERDMKTIFFGAIFWLAALTFAAPTQAGPYDLSDDSYVTQPH